MRLRRRARCWACRRTRARVIRSARSKPSTCTPLSFREYLDATGDRPLRLLLDSQDAQTMAAFSEREVLALKTYYLVGGMPAVVNEYVESEDFAQVRALQNQILEDYTRDFAKHMPMRLLPKALDAWRSIPAHLSHENKKFVFGRIREGARAKDFEDALILLQQAGLISTVSRVKKPALPLSAYDDYKSFKVFLLDVGLLGAMSGVDAASIVQGSGIFTEFKGALTEQYVCQQLISDCGVGPYYWSAESSTGEIDFLAQDQGAVYAMEVKAEENLRAKSLRAFKQANPQVKAVRFSLSPYRQQDWMRTSRSTPSRTRGCGASGAVRFASKPSRKIGVSTYRKRLLDAGVIEEGLDGSFSFALPGFGECVNQRFR